MSIAANYPTVTPSLDLDFANSQQLDPRISFTRAGTGTYYDGETSALAEQNLLLYSQVATNAVYNTTAFITATANTADTTAPDGTSTANKLVATAANGYWAQNPNYISSLGAYTISCYAKAGTTNFCYFNVQLQGTNYGAWFNLTGAGSVGTTDSGATPSIVSVGSGWYRLSVTATRTSTSGSILNGFPQPRNSDGGVAVAGNDIYVWGVQLEQKVGATPYQLTTTATITNYIPQLLTAIANQPRFDFNPITRQSLGLLMEQQSTNLVVRSEEFDNASWTKTNTTVTANQNIAPDGNLTADKLSETAVTSTFQTNQQFILSGACTYTVYAKAAERKRIAFYEFRTSGIGAIFDLSTGTVVSNIRTGVGSITSVGNGWYRCQVTGTQPASSATAFAVYILTDTASVEADITSNRAGTAGSGVYLWGGQLENIGFPTSYIPTTGSAVIRAQDFATITGTNFSSWFNNQQGTVYCSGDMATVGATFMSFCGIDNGVSTAYVLYKPGNAGFTNLRVFVTSVEATIGNITANTTQQASFFYNNILPMTASGSLNGATAVAVSSPVQPSFVPTQLSLGRHAGTANPMTGHIRKFAYYSVASTTAQMQAITGS
jgi:hypothetical protein